MSTFRQAEHGVLFSGGTQRKVTSQLLLQRSQVERERTAGDAYCTMAKWRELSEMSEFLSRAAEEGQLIY